MASYDEDTTTMAVEAARNVVRAGGPAPRAVWLATTTPAYLDKTNATAVHAALRFDRTVAAYDAAGSVRSTSGALRTALEGSGATLVIGSDLRTGRPGSAEESAGADAAAAVLIGDEADGPVLAELLGSGSVTEEFLDRWRAPGEIGSRVWEERFAETKYVPLAAEALRAALAAAGVDTGAVDSLVVSGMHERACAAAAKARAFLRTGSPTGSRSRSATRAPRSRFCCWPGHSNRPVPVRSSSCWCSPTVPTRSSFAPPTRSRRTCRRARLPPRSFAARRSTMAATWSGGACYRSSRPVVPNLRGSSASAAGRTVEWKFGLSSPAGVLADQEGTVTTFTVDRLVYSQSPPVVFAVVDFDDGSGCRSSSPTSCPMRWRSACGSR